MLGATYPTLIDAIGTSEGYGIPGAIPTLANNPGDIVYGPFAIRNGATGYLTANNGQQIAVFPDYQTGYNAANVLIDNNYAGGSITDLASKWLAGSSSTDVQNWINNLGLDPNAPVTSYADGSGFDSGYGGGDWPTIDLSSIFGFDPSGSSGSGDSIPVEGDTVAGYGITNYLLIGGALLLGVMFLQKI